MNRIDLKQKTLKRMKLDGDEKAGERIDRILAQYPDRYKFDGQSVAWLERQVKLMASLEGER